jgi:hypothetical protein
MCLAYNQYSRELFCFEEVFTFEFIDIAVNRKLQKSLLPRPSGTLIQVHQ